MTISAPKPERELVLELALWCYYAKHQEEALCECRMCVTTRRILHLQAEDDRTPAQRKTDALDRIGDDKHQIQQDAI
jgi:hypothetical protein